jgi:hypothetical protein
MGNTPSRTTCDQNPDAKEAAEEWTMQLGNAELLGSRRSQFWEFGLNTLPDMGIQLAP